jgi:deoxyribonuclease-1
MSNSAAKKLLAVISLVVSAFLAVVFTDIQPPATFQAAKKVAWEIHADNPRTFYCGCRYQGNRVDLASCGYQPRKNRQRASRVEWEHVVPAWVIGHQRQCWKKGGRDHCSANDPVFARAEADLHNLVPSIGEVNGDRSNYPFAELPRKPHQYGQCDVVVDFAKRQVMPREEVRGTIARTYLYMHERYQLRMSKQDQQLYGAWNRMYPVTDQERRCNQAIACQMGWGNPHVGEVELWQCGLLGRVSDVAGSALGIARGLPLEELGNAALSLLKH